MKNTISRIYYESHFVACDESCRSAWAIFATPPGVRDLERIALEQLPDCDCIDIALEEVTEYLDGRRSYSTVKVWILQNPYLEEVEEENRLIQKLGYCPIGEEFILN